MTDVDLGKQIGNIKAVLQTIEAQIARGRIPPQGLDQVKASVDDVRLRLWAIMSAASSGEYSSFVERFRIRRAGEICAGLAEDIESGKLGSQPAELQKLGQTLAQLVNAIATRTREA